VLSDPCRSVFLNRPEWGLTGGVAVRVHSIDRRKLAGDPLPFPTGEFHDPAETVAVFDRLGLPDGFPFVLDDDGRADGCHFLNQYLLDAWDQRAFALDSVRRFHIYNLGRFLRSLRASRADAHAANARVSTEQWLAENGEPKVDLTDATRHDLVAYRDARALLLEPSSLRTEMGCISAFYRYAHQRGWIATDPVPRWGQANRNTLLPRTRRARVEKFLSEAQTRHFLEAGLRGDGPVTDGAPAFPERDYVFGLLLATTGLRREEAGLLLDGEIPTLPLMPPSGVDRLVRRGKGGVSRSVYVTTELVSALTLYRNVERPAIIEAAQPRLRRMRREGQLFVVDDVTVRNGALMLRRVKANIIAERLPDEDRARAVHVLPDGRIEPLGLFLARGGLPPAIAYWNEIFADARDRVDAYGSADRPPAHITVAPHTMRHTFAVRMLAALMREGEDRANDPYFLLVNPLLTVQQLLGHASVETTQQYLFAAENWHEELPTTLRRAAAELVTASRPTEGVDA
jgi:integrase